ncbi:uncharacterized protein HHUB_4264 (plasmid) [Halobacterium hubeiense]|uniref:Uncharacterized protein n=1 Tax=Halobacterium hubeiense TaxID=1407499 RepID=A0A0U5D2C5_9EURY|nr:hypothetical protein [Halobacterium hubeiense]CQH64049.1 uncharacterized protein HHUB_4264 [Halobacterium hubeiense]
MKHPDFNASRHDISAAVIAGALAALLSILLTVSRTAATNRTLGPLPDLLPGLLINWVGTILVFAPLLLAVRIFVRQPTRWSVAAGAALVYVVDLLVTLGTAMLGGAILSSPLSILVAPLESVVTVLAIATAVWLAYHDGYDWLVTNLENVVVAESSSDPQPVLVADTHIAPRLTVRRGVVAASVAALVAVIGLVTASWITALLTALVRRVTADPTAMTVSTWALNAGIPLGNTPVRWLFEASFLLAVLFVTGPRLGRRAIAKAIIVVFAVQSALELAPMVRPPFEPVYLLATPGPIFTPLGDVVLLCGIATALWIHPLPS